MRNEGPTKADLDAYRSGDQQATLRIVTAATDRRRRTGETFTAARAEIARQLEIEGRVVAVGEPMPTISLTFEEFLAGASGRSKPAATRLDQEVHRRLFRDPSIGYAAHLKAIGDELRFGGAKKISRNFRGDAVLVVSSSMQALAGTGYRQIDDAEAMSKINALRGSNSRQLTRDDVYIHRMEAVNDQFVPDRFGRFNSSTIRNTAAAAERGQIAFMNSHRTGGVLSSAELPYGRTFAGAAERAASDGKSRERAVVWIYMLRGHSPNGSSAPSTDDVHAAIDGGTLFDVSVGIPRNSGRLVCDVCDGNLETCAHFPGRTSSMDEGQISKQRSRGIPNGAASFTIDGATPHEVSAVFAGAVPDAGFRAGAA